ncbi:phenylalanyl-tRNA synthetase subunit alpha [Roseibium litorale]|uniref:Phenylalanyl-tRNA synthetase subunit alpha n=1 Tax=Roseibium litorale TaxID=2803841 RepID=A0ABR9CQ22_9HYPH|nr:phenylalanyl-tRNA synthetase subunit alpha [Roseibium litorale]MBD8892392.1 phenylalanyl-tRNA synthetase subunit alpha [Roseibium litorale]
MPLISRLFTCLAAVVLCLSLAFPASAQSQESSQDSSQVNTPAKTSSDRVSTPTSFLEACAEKIESRGRLRFCDTYFQEKLGPQADALLYLRDRITGLRASHEAAATEKYNSFLSAVAIVAFLTIVSIVLVASEKRIQGLGKWASLASSAALLVVIVTMSLGWLGKYRAEYAAQVELGMLRDRIEAESAQVIATGKSITPEMVTEWTRELGHIGERFANNYGAASPLPEFSRFKAD